MIEETQTRFSSSIKEGEQTIKSVTYETEDKTFRYFDRNFDKEPEFGDMIIFEKLEITEP